jgi:hypothetical protein
VGVNSDAIRMWNMSWLESDSPGYLLKCIANCTLGNHTYCSATANSDDNGAARRLRVARFVNMKLAAFLALLSLLVACKHEDRAAHTDSVLVNGGAEKMDSARPASDETRMQHEIPWQCRSELVGDSYEHSITQGFVGVFRGLKLYYEVWDVYGPSGTSSSYVLLRTDTAWNDTFDICMPQPTEASSRRDTLLVERLDSTDSYRPTNLNVRDVPGMFQVLRYGEYGYQNYSELNQDKDQRIYINGSSLYIQHWDSPRYDDATLELERYNYSETRKMFVYKSTKVLKTERRE